MRQLPTLATVAKSPHPPCRAPSPMQGARERAITFRGFALTRPQNGSGRNCLRLSPSPVLRSVAKQDGKVAEGRMRALRCDNCRRLQLLQRALTRPVGHPLPCQGHGRRQNCLRFSPSPVRRMGEGPRCGGEGFLIKMQIFEQRKERALIRPVGHLLPSCGREKATLSKSFALPCLAKRVASSE